jgi:hypothetical protein
LADANYSTIAELSNQLDDLLAAANVPAAAAQSVQAALSDVEVGDHVHLLLTGLPYDGAQARFVEDAAWGAVLVTPLTRATFLRVFNDFSARGADVNDHADFLRNYLAPDPSPTSMWKRYIDMLHGMTYAQREITGEYYDAARYRPFTPALGTTWLRYITFRYTPALPQGLEEFLADAANREEIAAKYLNLPHDYALAIKIPFPLAGTYAFLFDAQHAQWFEAQRDALRSRLHECSPYEAFDAVASWQRALDAIPVPHLVIEHFDRFLRSDDLNALTLRLA